MKAKRQLAAVLLGLALVFGLSAAQLRHTEREAAAAQRFNVAEQFLYQLYGGIPSRYQQSLLDAEVGKPYRAYRAKYEALATPGFLSSMERSLCPYVLTDAFVYETGAQLRIDALALTRSESGDAILYPFIYAVDFRLLLPDGTESEGYRAEGQLTIRQQGEETLVHDVTPNDQNLFSYLAERYAEGKA